MKLPKITQQIIGIKKALLPNKYGTKASVVPPNLPEINLTSDHFILLNAKIRPACFHRRLPDSTRFLHHKRFQPKAFFSAMGSCETIDLFTVFCCIQFSITNIIYHKQIAVNPKSKDFTGFFSKTHSYKLVFSFRLC